MSRLADALYSWRHTYRWNQQRVADELGVTVRTVGRWERHESHPDSAHCWEIAALISGPPPGWSSSPPAAARP
jgi:transcriptional regulator with XRE-family HTH domain